MASHIATIRGSSRMAAQQQKVAAAAAAAASQDKSEESLSLERQSCDRSEEAWGLSNMSLGESGDGTARENSVRRASNTGSRPKKEPVLAPPTLEKLSSVQDIEAHTERAPNQMETLEKLEARWMAITENLDKVIRHLVESSDEITKASGSCLYAFQEHIETTCDQVDLELKAMYHLMTKCDELTTKLSIASSFRDEIKTLRKSVETLEALWKTKPSFEQRRRAIYSTTTTNEDDTIRP